MSARGSDTRGRVLRFYPQVRSAHVERARSAEASTVLYRQKRTDFDPEIAWSATEFRQVTWIGLMVAAIRLRPRVLELPEPLWLEHAATSFVLSRVCRLSELFSRHRLSIVTYAIDNSGPERQPRRLNRRAAPLWRMAIRILARAASGQLDRICFGTSGAQVAFEETVGARWLDRRAIDVHRISALPSVCACYNPTLKVPRRLLYIGELHERKGFDALLKAWGQMAEASELDGAHLVVLGTGVLAADLRALMEATDSVTYLGQAGRSVVHQQLNEATALILASQPGGRWREQVGLPLVEALAHGCRVLASTETGIADDLLTMGHVVVATPTCAKEIARAISSLIQGAHDSEAVVSQLPAVDGRGAADQWLLVR